MYVFLLAGLLVSLDSQRRHCSALHHSMDEHQTCDWRGREEVTQSGKVSEGMRLSWQRIMGKNSTETELMAEESECSTVFVDGPS